MVKRYLFLLCSNAYNFNKVYQKFYQMKVLWFKFHFLDFNFRKVQNIIEQEQEMFTTTVNRVESFSLLFCQIFVLLEKLCIS